MVCSPMNHSSEDASSSDEVDLETEVGADTILKTEAYFLNLLFLVSLVATKDSSPIFIWMNRFICVNAFVIGVGALIYISITSFVTREHTRSAVSVTGRVLFCLYSSTMYIYISGLARCSPGLVTLLRDVGRREPNNSTHSSPCNKKYPIKAIVLLVLFLCVLNVLVTVFTPGLIESLFGLTHHPVFLGYLFFMSYILSLGWLISIPFVYLGCKVLTNKIQYLTSYIQTEFHENGNDPIDLFFVMAWHDELYEKNRLLTQGISGLVTLTIGFLAIASTTIAIHIAIIGISVNDTFWFLSNFFVLVATCYPVAELEIQNKFLHIELGALPMPDNMPNLNLYLNLYQTCAIKASRSEFGIFVKGTKFRITFNALIRIGSITLSVIIFFGGALRVAGR